SLEVRRPGSRPTARRPVREQPASEERCPPKRAHVVVPCAGSSEDGEPQQVKRKTKRVSPIAKFVPIVELRESAHSAVPAKAGMDAGIGQATKRARRMPWR